MTSGSEQTPAQLPALPSSDDSSWASATESGHKRLVRLRGYLDAGRPVWWRRNGYHKEPFRGVEPKWHVFAGRTRSDDPSTRWVFTWHTLCDYTHEPSEILFGPCEFKVTRPTPDTRCKYCKHALDAINNSAATGTASTASTD